MEYWLYSIAKVESKGAGDATGTRYFWILLFGVRRHKEVSFLDLQVRNSRRIEGPENEKGS